MASTSWPLIRALLMTMIVAIGFGTGGLPWASSLAAAITLPVTKTADTNDGVCDADCSLREAIAAAIPGDTVIVPAGTYTLTLGSELTIGQDLILTGAGATSTIIQAAAARGAANWRVFNITGGNVAISGVTIRHGNISGEGGGVYNTGTLTLTDSAIRDNTASWDGLDDSRGGGIRNLGTLTVAGSLFSGNFAAGGSDNGRGGAIYNTGTSTISNSSLSGNSVSGSRGNSNGGGIQNGSSGGMAGGTLTLSNSTINGNTATWGGGIYNGALAVTLAVTNSTISGNSASWKGGGIRIEAGPVTLTNTTITGNSASGGGGGIWNNGTVAMVNTIIANSNSGNDCAGNASFTSLGHNLDSDGTCGLSAAGDLSGVDPLLGPLQDNGGPTFTHALLAGSPAIDAGDDSAAPATDQRGYARPAGAASDIGSFEFGASPVIPPVAPSFAVGTRPYTLAFDGSFLWVGDDVEHTLKKVDPSTGAVVMETSDLGGRTRNGILFDGTNVWLGTAGSDGVKKIRPSDGAVLCSITTAAGPNVLAYDGVNVWVGNTALGATDSVTRVRASDCANLGSTSVGDGPHYGAFSNDSLWVANSDSNNVTKQSASGAVQGTFTVGTTPLGVASVGDAVWVASRSANTLTKLRTPGGTVLATASIADGPHVVGYDGTSLWVSLQFSGQVVRADPVTGAVLETFDVGLSPIGLVSDGSNIWVANSGDGTITKLAGVAAGVFVTETPLHHHHHRLHHLLRHRQSPRS